MKKSWRIRLTSAVLAAVTTGSAIAEPVFAAQNTTPIASVATIENGTEGVTTGTTEVSGETDLQTAIENYMSEQLGTDVTVEPADSFDALYEEAEEVVPEGDSAEKDASASGETTGNETSGSETTSKDASDSETSGNGNSAAASEKVETTDDFVEDITTDENGAATLTTKSGNKVTVDSENGTITSEINSTREPDLQYNAADAAQAGEREYLGTDSTYGTSYYKMEFSKDELEEYDSSAEEEAAEMEAVYEWARQETLSGEALEAALAAAADWDEEVRNTYYEPVYADEEGVAVQSEDEGAAIDEGFGVDEGIAIDDGNAVDDSAASEEEISASDDATETVNNEEYYAPNEVNGEELSSNGEEQKEENEEKKEEQTEEQTEEKKEEKVEEAKEEEKVEENQVEEDKNEEIQTEETTAEEQTEEVSNSDGREIVGYRLKRQYENMTAETDRVSFGVTEEVSVQSEDAGDADVDTQSDDDEGVATKPQEEVAPEYQSTTVLIVDANTVVIRVFDKQTGKGIVGAAVTVVIDGQTQTAVTTMLEGDPSGAGSALIKMDNLKGKHDAFISITAEGYHGVTRVAEVLEGGTSKDFKLEAAQKDEIYLRGVSLDGIDVFDKNYDLYVTTKNKSVYDIVAFVEKVSGNPEELPDALWLTTGDGKKANDELTLSNVKKVSEQHNGKATKKVTLQSGKKGYAAYTFTGTFSYYSQAETDCIFKPGDTISLQFDTKEEWSGKGVCVNDKSLMPLKISVSLPVNASWLGYMPFSLSFSPNGASSVKMPSKMKPFDGTLSVDSFYSLPIIAYGDVDGTIMLGYGEMINLNEWAKEVQERDPEKVRPRERLKNMGVLTAAKENIAKCNETTLKHWIKEDKAKAEQKSKKIKGFVEAPGWKGNTYFGFVAILQYDRRSGCLSGAVSSYFVVEGSYTFTAYCANLPFYAGFKFSVSAALSAVGGVNLWNFQTDTFWNGWSSNTGLAFMLSLAFEAFAGFGVKGLAGAEFSGGVSGDFLVELTAADAPSWAIPLRLRIYVAANVSFKAYFFFVSYKLNLWAKSWRVLDTWNLDDPKDTRGKLPKGKLQSLLTADENGNNVIPSALIADNELRDAVGDAANTDIGMYVQRGTEDTAEVTIAQDGSQTVNKDYNSNVSRANASSVEPDGKESQILQGITTSIGTTYVGADTEGRYFRIANVIDNENYPGKGVVPRVVMTTATAEGITGEQVALPATKDTRDGKVYGYDYNFGVYMVDDHYCYVAIASTCVDPTTVSLEKAAENSRIRVILMKDGKMVDSRVLEKPAKNGTTAYLYTGQPVVYGDNNSKGARIGGYVVACTVTTDLNRLIANMASQKAEDLTTAKEVTKDTVLDLPQDDSLYYATNIPFSGSGDYPHATLLTGSNKGYASVQLVLPKSAYGYTAPIVAYVADGNRSVLNVYRFLNSSLSDDIKVKEGGVLYLKGLINNLQHVNQKMNDTLYCTVDGQLTAVNFWNSEDPRVVLDPIMFVAAEVKTYPKTTDTGEEVSLPDAEVMQFVEMDGTIYLVTALPERGDYDDTTGNYKTNTVITTYAAYTDGYTRKIAGPRQCVLKDRQVFSAGCAVIRKKDKSGYVLRLLYLADQQAKIVRTPQSEGTLEASNYMPGVTDDVCNMYMWDLHSGVAGRLNSIAPDSYIVRKQDGYLYLNAEVENIGSIAARSVTVRVATDETGTKDAQDIEVYFSDDGTASGSNRRTIGPGSKVATQIKVPLKPDWDGVTHLWAAVIKVNGQNLTNGYQPIWIESGQLLDSGMFEIHAEEEGIGREPYAAVRLDNYSSAPFNRVAVDMEVSYYDKEVNNWTKVARYKLDTWDKGDEATGYDGKAATLHVPLSEYWNEPNVYAVRFSIVSIYGDITLNNTYAYSEVLQRPDLPEETQVKVTATVNDATMGSVSMLVDTNGDEQDADAGQNLDVGTGFDITATAREGYQFDHWEVYDHSSDSTDEDIKWITIPDQKSSSIHLVAGSNVPGLEIGKGWDSLSIRAVFESDGSTRVVLVGLEKVVTTDDEGKETIEYLTGNCDDLVYAYQQPESTTGTVSSTDSLVQSAKAYRLRDGATLEINEAEFDPDEWRMDGWYYFTYDQFGNITVDTSRKLSYPDDVQLIKNTSGLQEVCIAAVFYENTNPGINVYLESNGGSLAEGENQPIDQWAVIAEEGATITLDLPHLTKLPQLTKENATFVGWFIKDSEGERQISDLSSITESYTTLFAKWEDQTVDVVAFVEDENYGEVEIAGHEEGDPGYKIINKGETATVTAKAAGDYTFDHWAQYSSATGDFEPIEGAIGLTYTTAALTEDTVLMAVFSGPKELDADVNVTFDVEEGASKPASIQVQLVKADGTKVGEVISLTADNGWTYTWKGLDRSEIYELTFLNIPEKDHAAWSGSAAEGFTIQYTCCADPQPEPEHHIDIDLDVDWSGLNEGAKRLEALKIRLNSTDGSNHSTVTLAGDGDDWSWSFHDMEADLDYEVKVLNLPDGYSYTVTGNKTTRFVIHMAGGVPTPAETISAPVAVEWNLNKGASRPDKIELRLYDADNEVVAEQTLTAATDWQHVFDGLTKGKVYTLKVLRVPSGYEAEVTGDVQTGWVIRYSGGASTEAYDAPVRIVWNLQSGKSRPDFVRIQLRKKGESRVLDTLTLDAAGNWQSLFEDVDKDTTYEITVLDVMDGCKVTVTGDASEGYVITYADEAEPVLSTTVDVDWTVEKGASKPSSIKVQLTKQDGTLVDEITLTADNNWTFTWEGLDKSEIYRLNLPDVPDKDHATWTGSAVDGFTIHYNCGREPVKMMDINVSIDWSGLNAGAKVPDEQEVLVRGSGSYSSSTYVWMQASDGWKVTLDEMEAELDYEVKALNVPDGYAYTVTGDKTSGFVLHFTGGKVDPEPEKISTSVRVEWNLNKGAAQPEQVLVRLKDAEDSTVGERTLTAAGSWADTFTGLTKGKAYSLRVLDVPSGYTAEVTGSVEEGYVILYSGGASTETIDAPVRILWNLNKGVSRPDAVKVQVCKSGESTVLRTITLRANDGWKGVLEGLEADTSYEVTVPDVMDGCEVTVTGSAAEGYDILYAGGTAAESVDVSVGVKWRFKTGTAVKPASIKVRLLQNGNPVGDVVTLSMNNGWQYTWTEQDKDATYQIQVLDVPATDEASVSSDTAYSYTINYLCGGEPDPGETVDAPVTVKWALNVGATRPETVQVRIMDSDGWIVCDDLQLKETSNWKGTFQGLYEGREYDVRVLNVPDGYKASVEGNVRTGWVITYTGGEGDVPETYATNVTVRWELNNGAPRPSHVSVRLTENGSNLLDQAVVALGRLFGQIIDKEQTLNEGNDWKVTYAGLSKNRKYVLKVTDLPMDYSAVVSGSAPEGYVITIYGGKVTPVDPDPKPDPEKPDPEKPDPEKPDPEKPDPGKPDPEDPGQPTDPSQPSDSSSSSGSGPSMSTTSSEATATSTSVKVNFELNAGAEQPEYIKVQLVARDGTVVGDYVVTLDKAGSWRYTWNNLNVSDGYRLEVLDYSGDYKLVVYGDAAHGYTITVSGGLVYDKNGDLLVDENGNPVDKNGQTLDYTTAETTGADAQNGTGTVSTAGDGSGSNVGTAEGGYRSETGDESQMLLWLSLILISSMTLAAWVDWKRREQ